MLKKIAHIIADPLAYIFNQSLFYSEVPLRWKHSFITPLLKKEPSSSVDNYRQVSITSFFCRIFEKVLKKHIEEHLVRNAIIPTNQHGFVKGKSTESNLLECINDWTDYLDNSKCCDVIYFDFAKAFDRVDHSKLLLKISKLKFHPMVCKWLEEYLSDRSFQVKIGSSFSSSRTVKSGVPQGGVLSPVLFALYTADLPPILEDCGVVCQQFADDIKIYRKLDCIDDHTIIQDALNKILEWSVVWKLPLAPEKTVHMRIGTSNFPSNYNLGLHDLDEVSFVRDLGFHYNNKLDFSAHYRSLYSKATARTYQIFKGLSTNDKDVLLKVFKSYIRPIMVALQFFLHIRRKIFSC